MGPTAEAPDLRATPDDVAAAYRLFLHREPDPAGLADLHRRVAAGLGLKQLISFFTDSFEYRRMNSLRAVDLGGYFVCVRYAEKDFGQKLIEAQQYEPHVCAALSRVLRPGHVVVDVGANVGVISYLAARLVGPTGKVIAYEPNADNLQSLYAGIVLNHFGNIDVRPFAASDRRQIFSLDGGTSNTYLTAPKDHAASNLYAQSAVLDEDLAGLDRLDVLKIDIEGHEPAALRGADGLLRRHRPTLFIEFNPRCLGDLAGVDPRALADQLFGYYPRLHVITPFGDARDVDTADDLMAFWRARDEELAAQHLLPRGMLHLDVIATP